MPQFSVVILFCSKIAHFKSFSLHSLSIMPFHLGCFDFSRKLCVTTDKSQIKQNKKNKQQIVEIPYQKQKIDIKTHTHSIIVQTLPLYSITYLCLCFVLHLNDLHATFQQIFCVLVRLKIPLAIG